jgi:putative ABC transport system permease protein
MNSFLQDFRHGIRLLRKNLASSLVIVLILAIGIGASSSLYSVIDGAWMHPFAYKYRGQFVVLRAKFPRRDLTSWFFSAPEYFDVRRLKHVFTETTALRHVDMNIEEGESSERISVTEATASMFSLTNNPPLLGRTFRADEDQPGGEKVAVISHRLWQHRYQGSRQIINKQIRMNGHFYTVIGVMPPRYLFWGSDVWIPLGLNAAETDRSTRRLWIAGVLAPGMTLERARAELQSFAGQIEREHLATNPEYGGFRVWIEDVGEAIIGTLKPALMILAGAVGLVLLMSCANVANLLLARASARTREIATRMALGAGRGRIVRQLLTEGLALPLIGGSLGFIVAIWCIPLLVSLIPPSYIAEEAEVGVNYKVLLFTVGVSLLLGLIFGLSPALQSSNPNFSESLNESGRGMAGERRGRRIRNLLIITEVAFAVIILTGAGLMIRSYQGLTRLHFGIRPDQLMTMRISLPEARYPDSRKTVAFYDQLLDRLASAPGVEDSAAVSTRPMAERTDARDVLLEGHARNEGGALSNASYRVVTVHYFRVMGIPLLSGRLLDLEDNEHSRRVAVISKTMATKYWPDSDPIGKRFKLGSVSSEAASTAISGANDWVTVVGVVGDVAQGRAIDSRNHPEFYLSWQQQPNESRDMAIIIRARGDHSAVMPLVRKEVRALDSQLPVFDVLSYDEIIGRVFGPKRLALVLLTIFAGIAFLLVTFGLYAIIAYSVSQRRHEIGIRMSVGAQGRDVLKLILGEGVKLTLIGITVGIVGAVMLTRLMSSLLFGVAANDPLIFLAVCLLLALTAVAACLIPARRASKIDPMIALRAE